VELVTSSFFSEELVTNFHSFEKNWSLTPNVLSRTGDQFSSLKRIGCQLPFFREELVTSFCSSKRIGRQLPMF
jgi:hypothetical protein